MSERGYIAVDRSVFEHPVFAPEPYTEREAWLWMIAEAVFRPTRARVGRVYVELVRGQLAYSTRFLATKWRWSEARVRRYLGRLKIDAMIDATATHDATLITICNYDRYQDTRRTDVSERDAPSDALPTQRRTTKPVEEDNPSPPSVVRPPRADHGRFLPQDWKPKQTNIDWAASQLGGMEVAAKTFEKFKNYWHAVAGAKGRKRDWDLTWRNWVTEEVERGSRNGNRSVPAAGPKPSGLATSIAGLGAALAKRSDSRLSELHPEGPGFDSRAAPGGAGDDRRPRPALVGEISGPDRR